MEQNLHHRRHHAPVNRADLLWCFNSLSENQHTGMAKLLGFEELPEVKQQPEPAHTHTEKEPDFQPYQPQESKSSPAAKQQGSAYYRVKDRRINEPSKTTADTTDQQLTPPDWFSEARPTYLQETGTRVPAIHQLSPEYPPLLAWSRVWPFLQRTLGANVTSSKADINKLVKHVAEGKLFSQIPKRNRFNWSHSARVLIDINQNNFPYRQDFIHLQERLVDWRGADGLTIEYIYDLPGEHVIRYRDAEEVIEAWQPPAADTPLLILSDMGLHSASRRTLNQWLAFGQQLTANKLRATVLMPVAERAVDNRLLRYFNCVIWDNNSRLRPVQGDHSAQQDDFSKRVEQLLALLFPAVRVDLGLLRSIRRLLPADQFDVGHEAAIWQHAAVNRAGDEWGWQDNSKGDFKDRFVEYFKTLSHSDQQQLIEQLGRHHAQLPDELYFEAMDEIRRLNLALPDQVIKATEAFIAMLVKTYAEQPEAVGLDLWVKRYLSRHDHAALRNNSEQQIALMVFEKLRSHQVDPTQIEWPADIEPQKILRFINRQQSLQAVLLRQKGMELELVLEQHAKETLDVWGSQAIVLLKLLLADSHIFLAYVSPQGQHTQLSLNLQSENFVRFTLPPGSNHQLHIATETISIEVQPAGDKPEWVYRQGMGADTTFIETKNNANTLYRWYWHPPEIGRLNDTQQANAWQTHPGFWYNEQAIVKLTPDWADSSGRDRYGLYAEVTIAGVKQRFRWIQPGGFLMGSPDGEDGRFDDETQHLVTLSTGYWLADTTCTQALWQAIMGDNPSEFNADNHPVENVSWNDAQRFIDKINTMNTQLQLSLPTEAQWEYACRAETIGAFHWDGEISLENANYRGIWEYKGDSWGEDALQQTAEVKSYPANPWGLYEMHGNVLEWCQDWYGDYPNATITDPKGPDTGDGRVLRGGSWFNSGRDCRSANRGHYSPGGGGSDLGFRLARGHRASQFSSGADQQPSGTHAALARGAQSEDGLRAAEVQQTIEKNRSQQSISRWEGVKGLFKK